MRGNTGEIQDARTTKASSKTKSVQMYNIFGLLIGVPDYSSEVIEKNKKI